VNLLPLSREQRPCDSPWSSSIRPKPARYAFERRRPLDNDGLALCFLQAASAASEAALENSTGSLRIHGAYGYSREYDIERLHRDAPLTCIGEGTNEMQRLIMARQWLERRAGK
jgi:alkylation response protein AidB-like acyl-CoA dehydrogenase